MRDEITDHIRRLVDAAPPLTSDQKARLAILLRPSSTPEQVRQAAQKRDRVPVPALPNMPKYERVPAPASPAPPIKVLAGVYFVRSGDKVKIGTSTNVPKRIQALRTMTPHGLELLAVAHGSNAEEAQLHARFAHLRTHGEWFRAEPELLTFIAELGYEPAPATSPRKTA